jgi:hypothetical protein
MALQVVTATFTASAGPVTGTFTTPAGNYVKALGEPVITDGGGAVQPFFSAADSPSAGTTTYTMSASAAFTGTATFLVIDTP